MNKQACFDAACRQLSAACVPEGILASTQAADNYRRVWARDAVVAGMAILSLEKPPDDLATAFRNALCTLAQYQHAHGQIPSNVAFSAQGPSVSYGGLCGRVDASAWFALGCGYYAARFPHDAAFRAQVLPALEKALAILEAWEFNDRHLVYVPLGGNWADEYLLQGYTLYDNVLRMAALEKAAQVWERPAWAEKARCVRATIRENYWLGANRPTGTYHPVAFERADEHPYWAAACAPGGYDTRFDLWANALALLFDLGDARQASAATEYFMGLSQSFEALLPAFFPIVHPGDPEWAALQNHYAYRFKNRPHHFHNGGIWPVVLGFAGAALVRNGARPAAEAMLGVLTRLLHQDGYGFREYLSSDRFEWAGTPHLSFSAAGYVLLHEAVIDARDFLSPIQPSEP